jgi:hypothetical protein
MRKITTAALALAVVGVLAGPPPVRAQPGGAGRNYDPRTVETVEGIVAKVDHVAHGGRSSGVHLTLDTAKGKVAVHLGPAWYVEAQPVRVRDGDRVRVEGSRVEVDGAPALIARELTKDGQSLTLRDASGVPAWAGRGRRGGAGGAPAQ